MDQSFISEVLRAESKAHLMKLVETDEVKFFNESLRNVGMDEHHICIWKNDDKEMFVLYHKGYFVEEAKSLGELKIWDSNGLKLPTLGN